MGPRTCGEFARRHDGDWRDPGWILGKAADFALEEVEHAKDGRAARDGDDRPDRYLLHVGPIRAANETASIAAVRLSAVLLGEGCGHKGEQTDNDSGDDEGAYEEKFHAKQSLGS